VHKNKKMAKLTGNFNFDLLAGLVLYPKTTAEVTQNLLLIPVILTNEGVVNNGNL
jgi:hypothetical protein